MLLEAFQEYCDISDNFDVANKKIDVFVESTLRKLDINKDEAQLKVITESGTEDDLIFLEEAAEDGAILKIKNAVSATIEAFKEFINNLKSKVIRIICNAETKNVLKKVESKVKLNPILARKKVKVIDKSKPLKIINKYKSFADSSISKVKAGAITEMTITGISTARDNYSREYKLAVAGEAALVAVAISKLIADVNSEYSQLPHHIDNIDKESSAILNNLLGSLDKEESAVAKGAFTACANFRTKVAKDEANEHVDSIMNKLSVLKREVIKVKDPYDGKTIIDTRESTDDDIDGLFDGFLESADDDFDSYAMESASDAKSLLDELDSLI